MRLPRRALTAWELQRRIACIRNGFLKLLRVHIGRLDLHPARGLIDGEPRTAVHRLQRLGNRTDAVAAGHVFNFKFNHEIPLSGWDGGTVSLPIVGMSIGLLLWQSSLDLPTMVRITLLAHGRPVA